MKANFKCRLLPLNEGQELNYHETFTGNEANLFKKLQTMEKHLKIALPQASISIKIEDMACTKQWSYRNGTFYDADYNQITPYKQLQLSN
jgi:hypothetical protein